MTDSQFERCKQCLNRKRAVDNKEGICNIKGKNLDFVGVCFDYDEDPQVVVGTTNKREAIKPNLERAKIAQALIWVVMALDAASAFSSYLQYNLLLLLKNEEYVSDLVLDSNDNREQIIALMYLVAFVVSIVTFLRWFRRAYYNLNIRVNCSHFEWWAVGAWFVPIISLFRPYQIMKEMDLKTTNLINSKTNNQVKSDVTVIGLWWALWIISNYIGQYLFKMVSKIQTIDGFLNSTLVEIINSILGVVLAVVTVVTIRSYSKKETMIDEIENREARTLNL
ncbi:DUF4328 domain-containing protein [Cellulophaga sp. 20_2_10]|uniref:DUF4328 domain-containing protein n=1 Tax=Cellulophaga sp. 20_2_10 TaxID=2942476 RepID=UPI00201A8B74|nr:DUF4328 domain-containing protein [Cellulophaga sp. 20_2_10]MCL5246427.1 DUF4328 domain-containing protein [Cellulophaga sp. 20_2_10]